MAENKKLYVTKYTNVQNEPTNSNTVNNSLLSDFKTDTKDFISEMKKSFTDRFTLSDNRRKIVDDIEFNTSEVSIANRHRDAITNILNNTFSGNIFDAGVNTLNLLNFGTKIRIAYSQDVDKNIYPFKYLYFYDDNKKTSNEQSESITGSFLETIVDPTILGFNLKIDFDNSPLFKGVVNTPSKKTVSDKTPTIFNVQAGENPDVNYVPIDIKGDSYNSNNTNSSLGIRNSALEFITNYKDQHIELGYAEAYLSEFAKICSTIFVSPETTKDYNLTKYKNSYIYEIKGLNKLDNLFVEYEEDNKKHESLELLIGEDIRMYVNRMAFLYRNLTISYNMGKKLIPENRLRFNLYIKISDIRNYTSDSSNENYVNSVREGYSRVIYELKDCEFLFDETITPDTITLGGFGDVNTKFADLKLRIKYRKVNRIFYSEFFDNNLSSFIIGDKFYSPDSNNYLKDLNLIGYDSLNTKKRKETDNNIPVVESINSKVSRLKSKGLFNEDNNDTAFNRFAKSVGNTAIKAGATILDDKLQSLKSDINDLGKNVFNNNFSSKVRDLLKSNVKLKTKELGKSLHLKTSKQFSNVNEVIDFSGVNVSKILIPNEDVHPVQQDVISTPNEDLHPNTNYQVIKPIEDLHPDLNQKIINPSEDLHPDSNIKVISPNEDLHPNINKGVDFPNEDLHPDLNKSISSPNEDLHPIINKMVLSPTEDLHSDLKQKIISPNEDLHNIVDNNINIPNENVNEGNLNMNNIPTENLHPKNINNIVSPNENLNSGNINNINTPNEKLHNINDSNIKAPNENINDNFMKFIKKVNNPPSNPLIDKNNCDI